jgi:bifunctional UDP-N-acetylglucosamine pyrophosphorylase/glucosamine-1-phosphate N-acetyltransferase
VTPISRPIVNLGAGTITCNYDGFFKHKTLIGEGAFVGTNSSLVAPVKIGKGAYIGSGSVITEDVPDAMAVERSPQSNREGGAARYREMKMRAKKPKEGERAGRTFRRLPWRPRPIHQP